MLLKRKLDFPIVFYSYFFSKPAPEPSKPPSVSSRINAFSPSPKAPTLHAPTITATKSSPLLTTPAKKTGKEALLAWCQNCTKDYPNVNVTNFTSSWADGLAFAALAHFHRRGTVTNVSLFIAVDWIDFASLKKEEPLKNFNLAFDTLEKMGVTKVRRST